MVSRKIFAELIRRQHAGTVAGMDAGFLDVFHDAGDHNLFVVAQRIDIDFVRVFEELVDQDRPFARTCTAALM